MSNERAIERLPEEAYTVLDRLDEKMIGSELAGLVDYGAQELIYSFKIDGKDVTGLSWAGAKTLARWMAEKGHPLDAEELKIASDEETWYADVKVVDKETGLGLWGTSKADKVKEIHVVGEDRKWVKNLDGTWKMIEKPDGFARTIALNKAQRNAILAHVPDKLIAEFIKKAVEEGRVRKVPPAEVEGYGPRKAVEFEQEIRELAKEKAAPPPAKEPTTQRRDRFQLGRVNLGVIAYNLKALGYGEDDVGVYEEEDGYTVEPSRDLSEVEHYKISGTLEPMGAAWEKVGYRGRWRIPKEEKLR